jgi:diguanylate cyclase (GGDEF)-like protein/PAS domain S-box-containing protein
MTLSLRQPKYAAFKWALLAGGILSGAGVWSWHDYRDTLEHAAAQQTNVARLLETHTSHVIANVDTVLDRVLDEVRDHDIMGKGGDRRWPAFTEMAKRLPVSGRLWLYREDGSAVMASHLRHSTNNATDREYFTAQMAAGGGLFIGETVVGKTTGKKVFNLSRRIETPDGAFAGVAMAAIDVDVFVQVVSELKLGATAAYTLARNDGAIIMRHPDAGAIGKRYNLTVLDAATREASGVLSVISQIDGINRQVAFRKHESLPLIVIVTLARDEILAPWRQRAMVLGGGLAVLFLVSGVLIGIASRSARREQRAVTRMQTVLDTVAEGICGLDAEGRFVFINPAGAQLLGYRPDELVGKALHATAHYSLPDGTAHPALTCPIQKLLNQGGEKYGSDYFWNKAGQGFDTEYAATRVEDLDGQRGLVLAFRDVSAVVAAQNALREQKQFVTSILDSLSEHVAVIDAQGVITAVNAAWEKFAVENGATRLAKVSVGANYLETCFLSIGMPNGDESAQVLDGIQAVLAGSASEFTLEYPGHSPSKRRWFVMHVLPLQGTQKGAVLIHHDVTERHQAEMQLRDNERYYRMLAENMVDIVWQADKEMRFTYINYADRRLRGFDREEVIGHSFLDTLTPDGQAIMADVLARRRQLEASGQKGEALRFEVPQRCKDGGMVWVEIMSLPTYDANGRISGFQGIGRDVSARKRDETERIQAQRQLEIRLDTVAAEQVLLQEQANRDPLTGLHNRRYLNETLPRELSRAMRDGDPVAVIMIDLDHFKQINDTCGHAAGDEVLKALADLLKLESRGSDLISRFGGEEFLVAMPGMIAEQAGQRVESWRIKLADTTIKVGAVDIRVTLSAGLAAFPVDGDTMEVLLARADEMLYRSKSEGRNRVSIYPGIPAALPTSRDVLAVND